MMSREAVSAQIESEAVDSVRVLRTGERRSSKKMSRKADRSAARPVETKSQRSQRTICNSKGIEC